MPRPLALLSFAAVLLAAGCAGEGTPAPAGVRDGPSPRAEVRPGVRLDRLLEASGDATPVLRVMRTPRSRRAEAVANRHVEGQTDSVVTWLYDGLSLETYAVTGGPTFIRRVTVTRGMYGTSDGLSVGETRAAVEAVLGQPSAETGEGASYLLDGGGLPVLVDVAYALGRDGAERASRITWRLPVD